MLHCCHENDYCGKTPRALPHTAKRQFSEQTWVIRLLAPLILRVGCWKLSCCWPLTGPAGGRALISCWPYDVIASTRLQTALATKCSFTVHTFDLLSWV